MTFNKKLPYGQISGDVPDNARYVQNGIRYAPNGTPVGKEPGFEPEPVVSRPAPVAPSIEREGVSAAMLPPGAAQPVPAPAPVASEPVTPTSTPDYENLHHMILKKMVKEAGGDYVDREQGVAFMNALKANG